MKETNMDLTKGELRLAVISQMVPAYLDKIKAEFPPSYRLTFLARCTNHELADADILFTDDSLAEIKDAIEKRMRALKDL